MTLDNFLDEIHSEIFSKILVDICECVYLQMDLAMRCDVHARVLKGCVIECLVCWLTRIVAYR